VIVATKHAIEDNDPGDRLVLCTNNFFTKWSSNPSLVVISWEDFKYYLLFYKKIIGEMIVWIGG